MKTKEDNDIIKARKKEFSVQNLLNEFLPQLSLKS